MGPPRADVRLAEALLELRDHQTTWHIAKRSINSDCYVTIAIFRPLRGRLDRTDDRDCRAGRGAHHRCARRPPGQQPPSIHADRGTSILADGSVLVCAECDTPRSGRAERSPPRTRTPHRAHLSRLSFQTGREGLPPALPAPPGEQGILGPDRSGGRRQQGAQQRSVYPIWTGRPPPHRTDLHLLSRRPLDGFRLARVASSWVTPVSALTRGPRRHTLARELYMTPRVDRYAEQVGQGVRTSPDSW